MAYSEVEVEVEVAASYPRSWLVGARWQHQAVASEVGGMGAGCEVAVAVGICLD